MTAADSLADHPEILFLTPLAIPVQRNELAIPSHGFDGSPAMLIRRSPKGWNAFPASEPVEFPLILLQPPKLFHSVFY